MWLRRYEVGTGGVRAACWDESNGGLGCLGQGGNGSGASNLYLEGKGARERGVGTR